MSDSAPGSKPVLSASGENLARQVGLREGRMIRKKREGGPNFWRSMAMVGAIGWAVAVPTLIGIAIGTWIDHRWPGRVSWTLMLLLAGLVLGCRDAWIRIGRAQEDR
jgi:ATP synthase protein I